MHIIRTIGCPKATNELFLPMFYLDATLPTAEANLACDEVLLDRCEADPANGILRFWESPTYFIVLGHGSQVALEVNVNECRRRNWPILRRCSGGGTVLQGPGCLNYALILPILDQDAWQTISDTNTFIMKQHCEALAATMGAPIRSQGSTDLVVGDEKFSGNAQRRKRRSLLFHGTFLLDFDIERLSEVLPMPPRQPDYRRARPHRAFLTNLRRPSALIKSALRARWQAHQPLRALPLHNINALVKSKYADPKWTYRC